MYKGIFVHLFLCLYIYTYACPTYIYKYMYIYICMHVNGCIRLYVFVNVRMLADENICV